MPPRAFRLAATDPTIDAAEYRRAVSAIEARALRVRRGATVALHDVSLDVAAGRVTGLLGPSG